MSVRLSESVSDIGLFTVACQLVEGETGRGHAYHTIRIRELQISDIHCSQREQHGGESDKKTIRVIISLSPLSLSQRKVIAFV